MYDTPYQAVVESDDSFVARLYQQHALFIMTNVYSVRAGALE